MKQIQQNSPSKLVRSHLELSEQAKCLDEELGLIRDLCLEQINERSEDLGDSDHTLSVVDEGEADQVLTSNYPGSFNASNVFADIQRNQYFKTIRDPP